MGDRKFIVIGNGFSIDLINKLGKTDCIDLSNLFLKGDEVVWPYTKEKGFLSRKHCESLWTLGARTTMTKEEANIFISDIITCLNVFNFAAFNDKSLFDYGSTENIYINAHNELSTYLKNLFIHYNSLVSEMELTNVIDKIPLISYIIDQKSQGNEVIIIDYNYDIFLERLLRIKSIPFSVCGFDSSRNPQLSIIKPHGSISFVSKDKVLPIIGKGYNIKNTFESVVYDINKLILDYNVKIDESSVNAIIPPSGDSTRLHGGWTKSIRETLKQEINEADKNDTLIIFGLSYDHVDRIELDEIITTISSEVNVKYVNPYPSKTFNSVLSSIFKNYIQVKKFDFLLEV